MADKPGIVKAVISAGKGPLPVYEKDTRVLFNYEVKVPKVDTAKEGFPKDADAFKTVDDSRKPWPNGYGEPLELVIGRKFQLPVLETCIKSMHVNEISQFDIEMKQLASFPMVSKKLRDISRAKVDPHFHEEHQHHCAAMGMAKTGYAELDELMMDPKDLRIIIHLLKVEQLADYKADNWQLNNDERLERSEEFKKKGNEAGDFDSAIQCYKESLTLLDQLMLLEKPDDVEWRELNQKTVPLYSNLSHCYLSTHKYREAENAASEALSRCPTNEKALYRRARAHAALYEYEDAERDLTALLETNPANEKLVIDERRKNRAQRAEKSADEVKLLKKMCL